MYAIRSYYVGKDGVLLKVYKGNEWTPEELILGHRRDLVAGIEHGMQQLLQFLGIYPQQCLVTGSYNFV